MRKQNYTEKDMITRKKITNIKTSIKKDKLIPSGSLY